MNFTEKEITLRSGKTVVLRSPREADAEALLCYLNTICKETDFLMRTAEECTQTVEQEATWIKRNLESKNTLLITCFADGKAVGNCQIDFNDRVRTRHLATVGIAVVEAYWGLGVGSAMFGELLAAARERGVAIVDLEFCEGNERARRLYEKMGFRIVGEKPNAVRMADGSLRKLYYMQNIL